MTAWTEDELRRIGAAQEVEIAPEGRIRAGGLDTLVTIEDADQAVYDHVDAAYRDKYGHYASIVDGITNDQARATTLRITPR